MADRVLLTGVSGYLGGHLALQLLGAGYIVRGSLRNLQLADKVRAALEAAGADISRLEFVQLDLNADAGWDDAMQDVRYVQHVASPFVTAMPVDRMELIGPAVAGVTRALNAAFAAKVERVVLTSSSAAIMYGHDKSRTAPFTAADWTNLDGRAVNAYIESKTRAERMGWDIAARHGRTGDLVSVNPTAILGPLLDDDPGTSVGLVQRLLNGSIPAAPRIYFAITDVRDVAAVHVAAMTAPDAGGRRFPVGNDTYSLMEAAKLVRPALPAGVGKLPRFQAPDWLVRLIALVDKDARGNIGELGVVKRIDASEARALLGRPFIPVAQTLKDTALSLIERKLV